MDFTLLGEKHINGNKYTIWEGREKGKRYFQFAINDVVENIKQVSGSDGWEGEFDNFVNSKQ